MALCRWSECDLYIYESREGIMCHVAARRYADGNAVRVNVDDDPVLVPIGLGHDGEMKVFYDYSDLLEYAQMLKEAGYDVPDWVIEHIREEAADEAEE